MKTLSITFCLLLGATVTFAQSRMEKPYVLKTQLIALNEKPVLKKPIVNYMRVERMKTPLIDNEIVGRNADVSSASAVTTEIKAFPNPFSSQVDIFITDAHMDKSSYKAELFDVQGRKVHSEELFLNQSSLQLSHLSKGVYILYIEKNGKNIRQEKLVKE
jgi:hypothetical protein